MATTKIIWKRDSQGLHADSAVENLRYYVRRDGGSWRVFYGEMAEVAGQMYPDMGKPVIDLDRADTQRLAKAVAEAFDSEPWSDGTAQRRVTRAINTAYSR